MFSGGPDFEKILYEKYWKSLKFILERQSLESHEVLDLCQETFKVVINKAQKGEILKQDALGAFIRSVGMNLLIEYKRKEKRRNTHTTDTFDYEQDKTPSIEQKISEQQLLSSVITAIEQLDIDRDRDILKLTYLEHESKSDICNQLSLTPAHYDRVIHRARERLKKCLQSRYGIDLNKNNLNDYLVSVIICLILQSKLSFFEKHEFNLGEFWQASHYIDESALLVTDSTDISRAKHAA